ncbi:efflux RND transporter periplasmic adaptor subunit, partial [bacterium]|nr:efflux RND transporter periplasmic adaptor subunit [bacterium]
PVAVERVTLGTASSYYTATATLEAENRAEIATRVSGVVKRILREEGDFVQAGEVLLLLEDDEAKYRLQQAAANLRIAESDYARRQKMREGGLLSDGEFETTENTLSIRKAELGLADVSLSYTRITAPFAGRVVRRHVDLGANVSAGTMLFEVMDDDPLLARVYIPTKRMGFVREGQEITMHIDSTDSDLLGVVRLISPIVDATTGTVKVTAEVVDHPEGTRAGDFAQMSIVTSKHDNVPLVPSHAVFEEQGQSVLYVVEDGKAVRRVVESGFVDGTRTEIVSGVSAGDLVVVKGQRELRDGAGVAIREGPPDVLAALEHDPS